MEDLVKEYYRGSFRILPLHKLDRSINYISDPITIGSGQEVSVNLKADRNHYLYIVSVAANYEPDIVYEVFLDRSTKLWRSLEPPSSIADYREIFKPPRVCREIEVRMTNIGINTRIIQVQIAGWQRPEDVVWAVHDLRG